MGKIRALVVDDDLDILSLFESFLKRKGIDVVGTAENGLEALEIYKDTKPDIVLMDVMMPGYDGVFGLEKIRQFDPKARIIIITGCVSDKRDQLKNMGAIDALSKPCEMTRVFELIDKTMKEQIIV